MKAWFRSTFSKLLLVLLTFSLIENVILFRQVIKLQKVVNNVIKANANIKIDPVLSKGEVLPKAQLTDVDGNIRNISLSGAKILFIFSSSCPACAKNFVNWKEIENSVGEDNVLYLSTDALPETKKYAHEKGIAARTFVFLNNEEKIKFKIYRIPQTLFVSEEKVDEVAVGVLPSDKITYFKTAISRGPKCSLCI